MKDHRCLPKTGWVGLKLHVISPSGVKALCRFLALSSDDAVEDLLSLDPTFAFQTNFPLGYWGQSLRHDNRTIHSRHAAQANVPHGVFRRFGRFHSRGVLMGYCMLDVCVLLLFRIPNDMHNLVMSTSA
ncbi:hypothetical protein BC832DRAFT_46905 [Gaertneriomyces semiglobifer]|nr:hypothetical protein BC832DRAFT_46905 [Gaertneriomyces semiglobifer]